MSRGNSDSQNANLTAEYKLKLEQHRYSADVLSVREEKDGDRVKNQDRIGLGYNYLFKPKWFFALDATLERDPVALLDRRISLNPAIGYDVWDTDTRTLNFQLGAGYGSEESNGETESGALVDWKLEYTHQLPGHSMELFHKHQIYESLSGRKNSVLNSQSGVRYDLSDDIYVNVQLNYDYDTEPAPGTDEKDITFIVGAGLKF